MKVLQTLALALALFSFMETQSSFARGSDTHFSCPSWNIVNHESLLENAALAELVYTAVPNTDRTINIFQHCDDPTIIARTDGTRDVAVRQLPRSILAEAERNLSTEFDTNGRGQIDIRPVTDTDATYFVCDRVRSPSLRLAVAFKWMLLGNKMGLGYAIGFVAGGVVSHQESVQAISLFDSNALGIPGTNPGQRSDWVSSLNQLIEDSCIFDFTAEVTGLVLDCLSPDADCSLDVSDAARVFLLIGHSLGGSISQYVAHLHSRPNLRGRSNQPIRLEAYSFNSMGMNYPIMYAPHHNNIHSVVIAGEILEVVVPDTTQIGNLYRYDSNSFVIPTSLIDRHSIETVQRKICDCGSNAGANFQWCAAHSE